MALQRAQPFDQLVFQQLPVLPPRTLASRVFREGKLVDCTEEFFSSVRAEAFSRAVANLPPMAKRTATPTGRSLANDSEE